jgi:hypothetical protein
VLGHLGTLVPGQRPAKLLGERADRIGDRVAYRLGSVTGQRRAMLGAGAVTVVQRREVQQHREAAAALDERPDRRAAKAEDQVALPVPGDGPVLRIAGPLADHDLVGHEALATAADASAGDAQRPAGPQACGQLAPQPCT